MHTCSGFRLTRGDSLKVLMRIACTKKTCTLGNLQSALQWMFQAAVCMKSRHAPWILTPARLDYAKLSWWQTEPPWLYHQSINGCTTRKACILVPFKHSCHYFFGKSPGWWQFGLEAALLLAVGQLMLSSLLALHGSCIVCTHIARHLWHSYMPPSC